MTEQEETMLTLAWYCCYGVGPTKWIFAGDWYVGREECNTEFTTEITQEDWDGGAVYATCPSCGAELTLEDDHPEIVKETPDAEMS